VVFVQAESFCDIRQYLPTAQAKKLEGFLPHMDTLRAEGRIFPLPPGAVGAYTLRTEFASLTGLGKDALGPWAFNPYLQAARRPLWSLARHLRGREYATLLLHPYNKTFFGRDKVAANLGFERFLSLDELGYLPRFGPYVSDLALGQCLLAHLERSVRPVFAMLISIEAHGPWRQGRLSEPTIARTLWDIDHQAFSLEQQLYLCHLRHMDDLLGLLAGQRGKSTREVSLWAYGDHLPSFVGK
jgi:phosphoglycerol transferase MdoB-like AlkP superfamily enzyme